MRTLKLVAVVGSLMLLGAACGSDDSDTADSARSTIAPAAVTTTTEVPVESTTVGTLPDELDATFAVLLDPHDVPEPDQSGFWYLSLSPDAGYAFSQVPDEPADNVGTLTVDGQVLTFSNEQGDGACPGEGRYRWAIDGEALTLTVTADDCDVRVAQNTAQPYRRCLAGPDTCVEPG